MPRRPRLLFQHAIYHVMTRGNRRATIFEDDEDRQRFLSVLGNIAERYDARCYAYCLMGTHYHLVILTPRGNLSDVMRQLNGVFAQASNRRHRRAGHVFEGRFRAFVIQRESYLRRVVRYVVLNPVRARLVAEAAAWPWSSYQATAGLAAPAAFLALDWLDGIFRGNSRRDAQLRFVDYVNDPVRRSESIDVSKPIYGSDSFQARLLTRAARHSLRMPQRWTRVARPSLVDLFADCRTSRLRRDETIWRAHSEHGYRLSEIAQALQLHPSTASLVIRRHSRLDDSIEREPTHGIPKR